MQEEETSRIGIKVKREGKLRGRYKIRRRMKKRVVENKERIIKWRKERYKREKKHVKEKEIRRLKRR